MNRAYDRVETRPFWIVRLIGVALVMLMGLVLAGLLLLIVFGGPLGAAIADTRQPRRRLRVVLVDLPLADAFLAILTFFALVYYLAPTSTSAAGNG